MKIRKLIHLMYKANWACWFNIKAISHNHYFRCLLWLNSVDYGKGVMVGAGRMPMLRISPYAKRVVVGDGVAFNNNDGPAWYAQCAICVRAGGSLEIGRYSGFNGSLIFCAQKIMIGQHVKIGGGTRIFDTDFHPLDFQERRHTLHGTKSSPVTIDDDVFVGTNCIIGKGVHIGHRSIIAAGSVVVKDVPADEVWGGNPATCIRRLHK